MSTLCIPKFPDILAVARSHGRKSAAPWAWEGRVASWPMQAGGGKTAFDVSGYAHPATIPAGGSWVTTHFGRGIATGAAVAYITATGEHRSLPLDFTITGWVLSRDITYNKSALIRVETTGGGYGKFLQLQQQDTASNAKWEFLISDGGTVLSDDAVVQDRWYWLCLRRLAGTQHLFVDGVKQSGSAANSKTFVINDYICGYRNTDVADVTFQVRGMADAEIAKLYADSWAPYRLFRRTSFSAVVAGVVSTPYYYQHLLAG